MLKKHPHILFLILLLVVFSIGYFYFFQVSPSFVEKPELEKPELIIKTDSAGIVLEKESIGSEHILFLLNEVGAYKLHKDIFTGKSPVIEFDINDENEVYFFSVEDNILIESSESEPDIKISASGDTIKELFNEETTIKDAAENNLINLEVYSDEKTLALKGYKAIYDSLNEDTNEITGEVILKMYPLGVLNVLNVSLLVIFSIIVGLVIEKEL